MKKLVLASVIAAVSVNAFADIMEVGPESITKFFDENEITTEFEVDYSDVYEKIEKNKKNIEIEANKATANRHFIRNDLKETTRRVGGLETSVSSLNNKIEDSIEKHQQESYQRQINDAERKHNIETNKKAITSNKDEIAANQDSIKKNAEDIKSKAKQVANNTELAKANAKSVKTNTKAIAKTDEQVKTNTGHIAKNTSDINQIWANTKTTRRSAQVTLQNQERMANQINSNSNRIGNLEHRMDKMKDDIDSALDGVALSVAIASAPQAVDQNSSHIAMGAGSYKGHNGMAISYSHRFERTTVSANIGTTGSDTAVGVGVGYSF